LLIDNITGTTCDMTTNDHYTFEGRATDFANRFYLVVNATDVDEFDADGDYNNFAYFNGNEWIVNGQGQLDLIDMTGRVLHSEYLAGESNRVSFGNVAAGVYVIRFGNKAQKIVIK
ncbi:MAG: T9SS type A sorting domain-containing protein, partial [Bacteroidales bacterium]|nr:T9SS type A sorting domain-containing protein [Bacteroidales bacterium]